MSYPFCSLVDLLWRGMSYAGLSWTVFEPCLYTGLFLFCPCTILYLQEECWGIAWLISLKQAWLTAGETRSQSQVQHLSECECWRTVVLETSPTPRRCECLGWHVGWQNRLRDSSNSENGKSLDCSRFLQRQTCVQKTVSAKRGAVCDGNKF